MSRSKQICSELPAPGMWSSPIPASEKEPTKAAMEKDSEPSLPLLVGRVEKASMVNSRWGSAPLGLP